MKERESIWKNVHDIHIATVVLLKQNALTFSFSDIIVKIKPAITTLQGHEEYITWLGRNNPKSINKTRWKYSLILWKKIHMPRTYVFKILNEDNKYQYRLNKTSNKVLNLIKIKWAIFLLLIMKCNIHFVSWSSLFVLYLWFLNKY